jgi:hypothetical protein
MKIMSARGEVALQVAAARLDRRDVSPAALFART